MTSQKSLEIRLPNPCLMLVTAPRDMVKLVRISRAAVEGGVNVVQLRDKSLSLQELTQTASMLRLCLTDDVLLINGNVEAALNSGADGAHLPEQGISISKARKIAGGDCLLGRSVHSLVTAVQAEREGADYLIAGSIFESRSHPDSSPSGIYFLRDVCLTVSLPVIAIGGITPERVKECVSAGAAGVAVLSGIMGADDPEKAARLYWNALMEAQTPA